MLFSFQPDSHDPDKPMNGKGFGLGGHITMPRLPMAFSFITRK